MANKTNMELTPIMSLSIMAMFALMVPVFYVARADTTTNNAQAAPEQEEVFMASPSPSPDDVLLMEEDSVYYEY